MKKRLIFLLSIVFFLMTAVIIFAETPPHRDSTKVKDAFEPYTADDWVVSPDEEPAWSSDANNVLECDIKGVISCYDDNFLRVDILLVNGISYKWEVWYSVKFEYTDMNEYYTYYTDSKKLIYEKEKEGKIAETRLIESTNSQDTAGVTDSGDIKDSDVYFIIEKKDHISGEKGKRYYLTREFLSGYASKNNDLKTADSTIPVDVEFEY